MGTDKGLLPSATGVWVQHSYELLASLPIPVKISVNELQLQSYCKALPGKDVIVDETELNIGGPLKGLMSAHHQFPDEDFFVLACDMQQMQSNVLQALYSERLAKNNTAYIYQNGDQAEPLCGIYTVTALKQIDAWYTTGELLRHGLVGILHRLQVSLLPLPEEWEPFFENFNFPGDLKRMPL